MEQTTVAPGGPTARQLFDNAKAAIDAYTDFIRQNPDHPDTEGSAVFSLLTLGVPGDASAVEGNFQVVGSNHVLLSSLASRAGQYGRVVTLFEGALRFKGIAAHLNPATPEDAY